MRGGAIPRSVRSGGWPLKKCLIKQLLAPTPRSAQAPGGVARYRNSREGGYTLDACNKSKPYPPFRRYFGSSGFAGRALFALGSSSPPVTSGARASWSGHAVAGQAEHVDAVLAENHAQGQKLTARGYSLIIKGVLCKGMLDSAVKHMEARRMQGFHVPPLAVALTLKVASHAN